MRGWPNLQDDIGMTGANLFPSDRLLNISHSGNATEGGYRPSSIFSDISF